MRLISIPSQSLELFTQLIKQLTDEGLNYSVTIENKQFVISIQ